MGWYLLLKIVYGDFNIGEIFLQYEGGGEIWESREAGGRRIHRGDDGSGRNDGYV